MLCNNEEKNTLNFFRFLINRSDSDASQPRSPRRVVRRERIAVAFSMMTVTSLAMAGCNSDTKSSDATTTQPGQPATQAAGAVKPTAEQEAAKQRGMAQGAAVQATLQKGPQPAPK